MFTFKKIFVSLVFIALAGLMSGCSDRKEINKVELAVGSFFDAARGLMLNDNEKIFG